jgi:hypothetical protein
MREPPKQRLKKARSPKRLKADAMSELSPTDLAWDGFAKRQPALVLTRACIMLLVINLAVVASFVAVTWSQWGDIVHWYVAALQATHHGATPPAPPGVFLQMMVWALPIYVASFVLFAAFEAACLRWLVRGESGVGLFGLTLGGDTWRVWLCYWAWLLLFVAFCAGVVAFYIALNAIGASIAGPAHILVLLVAALAPIGLLALAIWGATTFAPAAAASIALKRFAFASAPKVTRGKRWALLGAFVIVIGGYVVVSMLTSTVLRIPIDAAVEPILLRALEGQDGKTVLTALGQALSTPLIIAVAMLYLVCAQLLACLLYVACFGVNAAVVREALKEGVIAGP